MFSRLSISIFVLLATVSPAWADWVPEDGHKMHFPQMPDANGWDVRISDLIRDPEEPRQWIVADDFLFTVRAYQRRAPLGFLVAGLSRRNHQPAPEYSR